MSSIRAFFSFRWVFGFVALVRTILYTCVWSIFFYALYWVYNLDWTHGLKGVLGRIMCGATGCF